MTAREITVTEWLEALALADEAQDEDAKTVAELARAWGKSPQWVRIKLRDMRDSGQIVLTRVQVRREALNGQLKLTDAYRIRKAEARG